jgi:hypothetical protein
MAPLQKKIVKEIEYWSLLESKRINGNRSKNILHIQFGG